MTELPTTKRRIPSVVRWILWVLLVQFVLMNISAAIYSYRLTHFYDSSTVEANPGNNIFAKTWKLFTGPRQAKSTIRNKPSLLYQKDSQMQVSLPLIHPLQGYLYCLRYFHAHENRQA